MSKEFSFVLIKIVCFVILVLSGLSATLDYLSYPYIYKLIVSDNKYGFDLPAISVCTERHVFFDKHKIIQHFGVSEKFQNHSHLSKDLYQLSMDSCYTENAV